MTFNPAQAEKLFDGIRAHVQGAARALERRQGAAAFPLPASARVKVTIDAPSLESDNVDRHPAGTDPVLKNEYVVISAHLDHVGVGEPINGDAIYNGAMDNASGIATLIETAAARCGARRATSDRSSSRR